jgi:paraquat-inducible protein B
VTRRWRPSLVWLIPLVVAVIGAWIAFAAYSQRGPTITITFQSAEGLEAGQTRVRHKEVEVGHVSAINLTPDFSQVQVTVELNRGAYALLSEHSRFWVVRARVGANGVSGLGTLFSGAYIAMDPGPPGPPARTFTGLETAPVLTSHLPGDLVELRAEQLGSLNIGSPVTFRQIPVGEVAGFDLAPNGQSVRITILVRAPYHQLIQPTTRFWDAGGVEVAVDANGLRVRSSSLVQLFLGGIACENPEHLDPDLVPPPGQPFILYPSHDKAYEKVYKERRRFVLHFDESVRGLTRGAPVEFRGMQVGEVEDIRLEFLPRELEGRIPVVIALEPERFTLLGPRGQIDAMAPRMAQLVRKGLRAQLRSGSLLTGSLYVDLGFHPQAPARALGRSGPYLEIPTLPSTMGAMVENLGRLAEKLQKLPLEEVANELRATFPAMRETLAQTRSLMARLDTETAPQARATMAQAQATLAQAQTTLASLERTLGSDSPTQSDLRSALEQFTRAARALQDLADTLERHPESMIFGKGKTP